MVNSPAAFPDWLSQRASISADKPAIVCGGETLTFAQLDAAAGDVAANLGARGVRPGDRVALLSNNSADYVRSVFGVSRAGAVLVPVNARLTATEVSALLRDCEPSLLLASDELMPHLEGSDCHAERLAAIVRPAAHAPPVPAPSDLAALHSIIYTSGTTGAPKGAMLSYGNLLWNAFGSAANIGALPADRWLACMPLFHVGGLSILVRAVLFGNTVEVHESFDPERVRAALTDNGITLASLVPTMLQRLLEGHEGGFGPDLRCILLGGGPVPPALVEECARRGIPVAPTYGLTEAASQVATLRPDEAPHRAGSAGKPLLPVELRIKTEDGGQCAPGEAGEIVLRGPTITSGYWRRPEATALAIRDGWLRTGDFGYVDDDGYLYVVDRRDDLILTGGENVYPAEVEAVLASHPDVREAGVFARPSTEWGQEVVAAVALKPGATSTSEDLAAFARERLAPHKRPKAYIFLAELPRNASGKLLRRELRQSLPGER